MTHAEEMQEVRKTLSDTGRPASARTKHIIIWAAALGALGAGLSIFLYGILDFAPYQLMSYEIRPPVVCPLEKTDVVFEANITRPVLGDIKRSEDQAFDTTSQWVNVDTGEKLTTETDSGTFYGRYGFRKTESNFARFAPNEPGRWRIEATITVHGWQALRPATQTLTNIVTESVNVREFDAPECRPSNL